MRALVVDDSKVMRLVEQRALESMGWQVTQAANGREAIAALEQMGACDLVLADWQMPEIKHLRQDARWASLVIIMVSSNAVLESIDVAITAGANDFVMKPFSVDALKERVTGAFHE